MRLILLLLTLFTSLNVSAQALYEPWQHSNDAVAQLWQRLHRRELTLDPTSEKTFLRSLLTALDIPIESQTLVFSKTSLQNNLIHPKRPRALYYNDHCYVGWVQGGAIEIIAIDPGKPPQFYTLDLPNTQRRSPVLLPSEQCFSCHETTRTQRVKGLFVRSVYANDSGQPLLRHGSFLTTPESPLSERWGGWYVTGKHGSERHMGNITATESPNGETVHLPREQGANLTTLNHLFDTTPYLTNSSDIVALMVLEHQCAIQNLLTAATQFTQEALERQRSIQEAFGEPITNEPQGSALSLINHHAQIIVKALLFTDEHSLPEGGIDGNPAFQDAFRTHRKPTRDGRSLKDFNLNTRLFKYRCSYMIYSQSFLALPTPLKKAIYQTLHLALAETPSNLGAHLTPSERDHLTKILQETHPELAQAWHPKAQAQ